MPAPIVGGLLAALASWVGTVLASSAVRYLAMKAVLFTLMVTVLPIVLTNWVHSLMEKAVTLVNGQVAGASTLGPQIITLTGLGAWFAIHLKLPEAASVVLTAVAFRMSLKLIPFFRL